MTILEKEVLVKYSNKTFEYYESVGYKYPRVKDKSGKLRIKRGSTILVNIEDLTDGSNVEVTKICDLCGKNVKQKYCGILICRKNNVEHIDRCLECQTIEKGIKKGIATESTCVATTNPEFAKTFWNKEDTFKYTDKSGKKIDFRCETCGNKISNKIIANVYRQGISCPICSDGIPYTEKFMFNILKQLNIEFEFHKSFKNWFENDNKRFYDFYIPSIKTIIETHGMQHYDGGFERYGENARSVEEEKENDIYKFEVALKHKINKESYIIIDTRISDMDFIKNSILNSNLSVVFDLSEIDWRACHEFACKSIVKTVCELWTENKNVTKISRMLQMDRATIRKYLKQGSQLKWCDYNSDVMKKSAKPIIQLTLQGDLIQEFSSQLEAANLIGIRASSILSACNRKGNSGGFKWMHKEDYESKGGIK